MKQLAALLLVAIATMCTTTPAWAADPSANAGADQTFASSTLPKAVTLSGSGTDPDGGSIVGYSWTMTYKPPTSTAALSSASVASPTFTADKVGTYRACLEVEDSGGEFSGTDWYALPTAACTEVMVTTANETLVLPAKGQRNTWELLNDWARALDALSGAYDAFVLAVADDTSSSEGASLVGTDTKSNLCSAATVEAALECLNTALTTSGPYLPLAAGSGSVVTGAIYSDSSTTIQSLTGTNASEAGTAVLIAGGAGTAASGATAAGTGATWTATAGRGGAADGADGGEGGAMLLQAGAGGNGSATHSGGDGADLTIRAGGGGSDGGGGAGANGDVIIGATNTAAVTIGGSGTPVNVEGDLDAKSGNFAIAGAAVTSTAAELNKLDGAGGSVTAANLTTLTDGSDASALHTHSIPYPATVTNFAVASTTGRTDIGHWSLPTVDTWTTVRCYGSCASTDGDATDCIVELTQHDATSIVTVTIPDGECGDTTGTLERWEETFAASGLGANTSGKVYASRSAGSGTCEIAGVVCVLEP